MRGGGCRSGVERTGLDERGSGPGVECTCSALAGCIGGDYGVGREKLRSEGTVGLVRCCTSDVDGMRWELRSVRRLPWRQGHGGLEY